MRALIATCLLVNALSAGQLCAVDLTKVDRTIGAEPVYETNSPKYCLLVFGSEAKTRVWLVLDGNRLFVDRNANGDLTEEGEAFDMGRSSSVMITNFQPSPSESYEQVTFRRYDDDQFRLYTRTAGRIYQYVGAMKSTKPRLATSRDNASILHFGGPITMAQYSERLSISKGADATKYRETWLRLMIGTKGLGEGTFAAYHCKCRSDKGNIVAKFEHRSQSDGKPINITRALESKA